MLIERLIISEEMRYQPELEEDSKRPAISDLHARMIRAAMRSEGLDYKTAWYDTIVNATRMHKPTASQSDVPAKDLWAKYEIKMKKM